MWGNRAECHCPFIYGDLLFVIADLTWLDTNPYSESMEPTYHVMKANMDQSGYMDITNQICSPFSKIIDVTCISSFSGILRLKTKNKSFKEITYNRLFERIYTEGIEWQEITLSESAQNALLQKTTE